MTKTIISSTGKVVCGRCGHENDADAQGCRYCTNTWNLHQLRTEAGLLPEPPPIEEKAAATVADTAASKDSATKPQRASPVGEIVLGILLLIGGAVVLAKNPAIQIGFNAVRNPFSQLAIPLFIFGIWKLGKGFFRLVIEPAPIDSVADGTKQPSSEQSTLSKEREAP